MNLEEGKQILLPKNRTWGLAIVHCGNVVAVLGDLIESAGGWPSE